MIYDAKGRRVYADPREAAIEAAMARMELRLAEAIYGNGPEERVRRLRESVLRPSKH